MPFTDELETFLAGFPPQAFRFRSPLASSLVEGVRGYLIYHSADAAGAVGKAQGEALLAALSALEKERLETLELRINSAGAHFDEPMEGLLALNTLLESLWAFRRRGVRIVVVCDAWLYGGMAMALAAVAHEIHKGEQARIGLLGKRAWT